MQVRKDIQPTIDRLEEELETSQAFSHWTVIERDKLRVENAALKKNVDELKADLARHKQAIERMGRLAGHLALLDAARGRALSNMFDTDGAYIFPVEPDGSEG